MFPYTTQPPNVYPNWVNRARTSLPTRLSTIKGLSKPKTPALSIAYRTVCRAFVPRQGTRKIKTNNSGKFQCLTLKPGSPQSRREYRHPLAPPRMFPLVRQCRQTKSGLGLTEVLPVGAVMGPPSPAPLGCSAASTILSMHNNLGPKVTR